MASTFYPEWAELIGNLGLGVGTRPTFSGGIKAALVRDTYEYSAAHDFFDDISALVVGTPQVIDNAAFTANVLDGDPVTYEELTGDEVGFVIIYGDTGTSGTSNLILVLDAADVTGIPFVPSGANVTLTWSTGGDKIARLGITAAS